MRRALLLSTGFLSLDQLTKLAAAGAFAAAPWTIGEGWGLTYVVNPGVYVWPEIPGAALAALHAVALASCSPVCSRSGGIAGGTDRACSSTSHSHA